MLTFLAKITEKRNMTAEGKELQARKRHWIPLCCAGVVTETKAARLIGCTPRAVSQLKRRYRLHGDGAFTHAHTGKSDNRKFGAATRALICSCYRERWQGCNFALYREKLAEELNIIISPRTLKTILEADDIKSPKWRGPRGEKVQHKPRKERPREGELVQLDASPYDWLMTGERLSLHGGIDDATHKIVGLYLAQNECRFGYSEVLRQQLERYGAAKAVYIDRHAALVKNSRRKHKTLEERLEYSREEATHWTEICKELDTEIIIALSPQAKGRIERLWQTLQGRLPFIFRAEGITTIDAANAFLSAYMDDFNRRFAVPAQNPRAAWQKPKKTQAEIDYLLQVRVDKTTRYNGCFIFHGFTFHLNAPRAACRAFTLCMSERDGVRAYMDGAYYPVSLADPLTDCIGDAMPQVEKKLVAKYCLSNQHTNVFAFRD